MIRNTVGGKRSSAEADGGKDTGPLEGQERLGHGVGGAQREHVEILHGARLRLAHAAALAQQEVA